VSPECRTWGGARGRAEAGWGLDARGEAVPAGSGPAPTEGAVPAAGAVIGVRAGAGGEAAEAEVVAGG